MLCGSCAEHQEYLLESGDGSQVVCEHQLKIDEETERSTVSTSSSSSCIPVVGGRSNDAATTRNRKRKFLTADRFAELASVKLRRKIAPIKKWRQLKERIPFAVLQVHSMEVASIKGKKEANIFLCTASNRRWRDVQCLDH